MNALRHGLLAKCTVLPNESLANFDALLNQHLDRFGPADGVEFGMLEEMASSYWRLRRAWTIEADLFDKAIARQTEGDDRSRLGDAWSELAESPKLQLLHRYQTALHHTYSRALYNLLLLRDVESRNPPGAPEASPQIGETGPVTLDVIPESEPAPSPESAAGNQSLAPSRPDSLPVTPELRNKPSPISGHLSEPSGHPATELRNLKC